MNPLCELPGLEELFDISLGVFDKKRLQIFSSLPLILNPLFALYGTLCKHQGCKMLLKDFFWSKFFVLTFMIEPIFENKKQKTPKLKKR